MTSTVERDLADTFVLPGRTGAAEPPRPALVQRLAAWVKGNRLFSVVLLVAVVLRVLVAAAYAPALEFYGDSYDYLQASDHLGQVNIWHPPGYPLLLRILSITHTLASVTTVQHLASIGAAVLVYRLMRRFGTGSIAATVATLPLLLDAYQLDVEQFVLSDTMFTALVVATVVAAIGLAARPTVPAAVGVGLLLAAVTLTRTVGLVVVAAVAVYLLVARVGWRRMAAAAVAVGLPVLGYALAFRATYGVFGLEGYSGRYLYGIVAPFADCSQLPVPAAERALCPKLPRYARPGSNQYVWEATPYRLRTGTKIEQNQNAGTFARRVIEHQPGAFADTVAGNVSHYFAPGRATSPRDWFVGSWQFPLPVRVPAWNIEPASYGFGGTVVHGHVVSGLAHALRAYQDAVFTPGPLLLLLLGATLVAVCLRGRAPPTRRAAALLTGTGMLLLVVPAATAGFDWRYLLPAQAVLVPGGLLAVHVIRQRLAERRSGRSLRALVALLAGAAVIPGLFAPAGYAAQNLQPQRVAATPATLPIGDRLLVHVGEPKTLKRECAATPHGYRTGWLTAFPVDVRYRSGAAILLQSADFAVDGYGPRRGPVSARPDLPAALPSVLLSARYPRTAGNVYIDVTTATGRLDYVDNHGAGAAAWAFALHPPATPAPIGSPCTPPGAGSHRHAGPPPVIDSRQVPAFTEGASQSISYTPTTGGRVASYDVRWRQGSSMTPFSGWNQPTLWQDTRSRTQTLVHLTPGYTYCFAVRAHTVAGGLTRWSAPSCTTRLSDDTALVTPTSWTRYRNRTGFYDATYTATTVFHATLGRRGAYSRIGLVAYRCPTCGAIEVYAGNTLVATVDLTSTRRDTGLFSWVSPRMTRRHHQPATVQVVSHDRLVLIDAFDLQR